MVANKKWTIPGVILAIGGILFFILQPGDAARIKKQFDFLSAYIDKAPDENQLIGAANAKRIRSAFTETVTIHASAYNYTRDISAAELPALVLSARAPYTKLSLTCLLYTSPSPRDSYADLVCRLLL